MFKKLVQMGIQKVIGKGKVSPTIKSVKPYSDKRFGKFAFEVAKTPTQRSSIVRRKESIKRYEQLEKLRKKREEGIKASKEMKRMVDTGRAKKIGGTTFYKSVPEQKSTGGRVGLKRGTNPFKKKSNVEKIKEVFGSKKRVNAKKGFPDLSGDGKTTFKDILIGRGVIKKKNGKNKKKVI